MFSLFCLILLPRHRSTRNDTTVPYSTLCRSGGPVSGYVLLLGSRYRLSDQPDDNVGIARNVVTGKIFNQSTVLARDIRDHASGMSIPAVDALQHAVLHLKRLLAQVRIEIDIDRLRVSEGEAAQV